ncbi:MurR/RpiR family transcriptional regulator [Paenibacillus hamazuiensis]|uniref:MurR/RpiR family transcriptional regulator n=1 Tax=Paenibacillus hamazuiensis TaxID=2936508 RepID=UPI00200FFD40|nr:MurR/RpiR family transcriptional regulator [Paenibacillus hamazuiensis]
MITQRASYVARIDATQQFFTDTEKKIAEFLLSKPDEIIRLSITELSEKTKSSDSSIIRFCRKIGYKGYQEMKIDVAQSLSSPAKQLHEDINDEDSIGHIKEKIFTAASSTILDTLHILDDLQLQGAIDALKKAKRIMILGNGASGMVALDAQHKFLKIGIPVITYLDNHMQLMGTSMLSSEDAVIAISHSGANKDILSAIALCKENHAAVIAITNFSKSPLTKQADFSLFTFSKETRFRTDATASRIAQLTIIDVLVTGLALTNPSYYLNNFQRTREATTNKRF